MENLKISSNKKYIMQGNKPFFWLGDTAWLLFQKPSEEEAYFYLKNRAEKGFNVIQAVLVYAVDGIKDTNKMYIRSCDIKSEEYWDYCGRIIKRAESLNLYMGLLPCWGSLIKEGVINEENVGTYADFLAERFKDYSNIIWILGGDIRPDGFESIYNTLGERLKKANPERLITFHPFGRCSSSKWFNNADWLDFNMFQSGHRRYDQGSLGKWDDNKRAEGFFGEDNFKYVLRDHSLSPLKPTLDGEPSYEWILQGLHDLNEPYWRAKHVRRYAYWSVFAGACGHTYGDNAVMQFYTGLPEDKGSYGVVCTWQEALGHEGGGQMKYLRELMEKVDFTQGKPRGDLLLGGQREKHKRIAVFGGKDFLFAYTYLGEPFELDLREYLGANIFWMSPSEGTYSFAGMVETPCFRADVPKGSDDDNRDMTLVLLPQPIIRP